MDHLIDSIKSAEANEMDDILQAVLHRYRELYPQWEISIITISTKENRNEQLDAIISLLENMKN